MRKLITAVLAVTFIITGLGSASANYNTQWQWQLNGTTPKIIPGVDIYGFDGFEATKTQVSKFKTQGKYTICYISAGSWEDWRPDAAKFPSSVKGSNLDGWAGEKWLDVRNTTALSPIMASRMDMCKSKGFDAVEVDNIDGYINKTDFPLTGTHQITYNKTLATLAHDRGLDIGLKNDVDQIAELEPYFDFAINEECFAYNECAAYKPFTSKGKLVLNVEYSNLKCSQAKNLGISSMKKRLSLDAWRKPCL